MCFQNRIFALIFRIIILTGCGYGLSYFLGFHEGQARWSTLVYYTNLSNLVCLLFYILLTAKTILDIKREGIKGTTMLLPHFKGAFVLMITITFLVYHLMLSGSGFAMADGITVQFSISNILLHYVVPIMVILDWFIFDRKNIFRWFDPLLWLIIPFVYFVFALIRAEFGGNLSGRNTRYPYFFIDVDALGWPGVMTYTAIIAVAFTLLGYLFFLIDKVQFKDKRLFLSISKRKLP